MMKVVPVPATQLITSQPSQVKNREAVKNILFLKIQVWSTGMSAIGSSERSSEHRIMGRNLLSWALSPQVDH